MSNFSERLRYYIENQLNTTIKKFEEKCNITPGVLYRAMKGGNLGVDKIQLIGIANPDLNLDWLINGEGKMLDEPPIQNENGNNIVDQLSNTIRDMSESGLTLSKSMLTFAENDKIRVANESKLLLLLEQSLLKSELAK